MSITRRELLFAAPLAVPALTGRRAAAAERITVAMLGMGRQSVYINVKQLLDMPDVQVVAVCDIDSWRLANAKRQVDEFYARKSPSGTYRGCRAYADYREVLADKSIDAVMIGVPDHWHVPMSIEAVKAGKDVSCEKPLTRCIAEGRLLADTVKKYNRVFRTDSEYRSHECYQRACELVLNGRIGKLKTIRTGVPELDTGCPSQPAMPVPAELDYERWQGSAPRAPYTEKRVHKPKAYQRPGWMSHLYYCDGMIANWGAHFNDVAQWGNGTDRTGPVEVEGKGSYPPPESFWNVLLRFDVRYRYANGVELIYKTDRAYVRFEGEEGWIQAERLEGAKQKIEAEPASVLAPPSGPNWRKLPLMSDKRDFIDAVRTRGQTLEDAEVGHRTTTLSHLGHIAIRLGKKLRWDPDRERFVGNEEANGYLGKPIHAPRA
jgi:myo-inositol 2-dehydrogenase / D-chiro-inositol 1-dehydrogenase